MGSIILRNFGDIVDVVENRAKMAGSIQDSIRDFVKGTINEYHERISTERSWKWRKFDRSFNFSKAITTGTANVTSGSREVTMVGITVSDGLVMRSIRFGNQRELYRIIGREVATNKLFLESAYVGPTTVGSKYKMYQYEFALPPDLDTLDQVYIDSGGIWYNGQPGGELEDLNVVEFNRHLSVYSDMSGPPVFYNEDGEMHYEGNFPPLDVMVLDYDFLAGEIFDKVARIRLFPIEPDATRLIHINYSRRVELLSAPTDRPLIPPDNCWVLVHFALAEWYAAQGSGTAADREYGKAKDLLKEMRQEYNKTDVKPKLVFDGRRYQRMRSFRSKKYLFEISRIAERP